MELILVMAERAWAHAMALKESTEPRAKFHSNRRLGKAAKWSLHLLNLCNAKADERTKLEAESYHALFVGNILVEKENWKSAHEYLMKAKYDSQLFSFYFFLNFSKD